jgi:hypothetical protein
MSKAAVQGIVLATAYRAVGSPRAEKRSPEWSSLTEAAMQARKEGGLSSALLLRLLSDFEGFVPPFDRAGFKETLGTRSDVWRRKG